MKASRYDLVLKVEGRDKPFYVIRRRIDDGGLECSCPRWVQERKECRHVVGVSHQISLIPRAPSPKAKAVRDAILKWPFFIREEDKLIERVLNALELN